MKPARANYNRHMSLREMTSGREAVPGTGASLLVWQITFRIEFGLSVAGYYTKWWEEEEGFDTA